MTSATDSAPARVASIDVFRGAVMFLMMAEVLRFSRVADALPDVRLWQWLSHHQSHVAWVGCTLHDLIQPAFTFLVGVALPFSIAARTARGQSRPGRTLHAAWRALALVLLGVFLRSTGAHQTNWTFEDTLSQIGLGYFVLYLLAQTPVRVQWLGLAVILVGYWTAFALYPLPPADFNYAGVNAQPEHLAAGFAAHWNKNSNLAWAFDTWFLNLFPRAQPFTHNGGGYATLSFIPTLGTMVLGLLAGHCLRRELPPQAKINWLLVAGALSLTIGWTLGQLGICPVVKRIWTPSWVLFSGGWCFLILAALYAVLDVAQGRTWAFPLTVIGINSIAAYCMAHLFEGFIARNLTTHLGHHAFEFLGKPYEPLLHGAAVLAVLWLLLFWMYRRRLFLRI
ncbi:MAG TPA: DUF5009 domain-containing protein [Verrucomicrobiota bacterium]|nr:DUF5009 domain-containing protein [Verrucomicrobiota bacterium]HNU51213.1 DUF5009 domain-containing protein [Verrucomicrobiota bacterium]